MASNRPGALWALVATSVPMFMVSLDNLVVTNALVDMSKDFQVRQSELQWVVNGYVLAFAGLLLAGAALGDRFGRRRVFNWGIVLFTLGSAACGLSGSVGQLVAARVVQGAGAAMILPVSLTLAVAAVPAARRALAVGVWGGVNGLGIAVGPLAGGLVTEGLDWHWIFWINVPVGLIAVPLALWAIQESRGRDRSLDLVGIALITGSVVGAVWGIVGAADQGWGATRTVAGLGGAVVLLIAFIAYERRSPQPLVPLTMYRIRSFMLSNAVSLTMYFGVFGSIFFLAQFMQGPMGYSPFAAGLRTLPWTAAPMVVVPIASMLVDRVGGGILQAAGSALQALALGWIAVIAKPDISYGALVPALVLAGVGMGLVFAANPATVISSVAEHEHNKASGVNNTIREFGGALGIAVLTTVFTHGVDSETGRGGNAGQAFVHGLQQAIWLGVAVVVVGALGALFIRRPQPATGQPIAAEPQPALVD
ncbi:DHA2 family efflux MFS transporter permease subunit [Kitasatospora sp. GP82]|uniref:MFS transporter n=1 Tax=Kitasatospora sp. GP82 TaxID=3035089 RepID=UPI002476675E|nr:DHA2 family efflux MFS transporter permease subunit [Kitasatospora sp. GP82]MDH6125241.1 EmrB/QacA subfamily drug resistance transporter [Kitasatospora sp. GP82]